MDFEEFLWANEVPNTAIDLTVKCLCDLKPIPPNINDKFIELFKIYMIVGGMPDCVKTYMRTKNFSEVLMTQRNLLRDYENDIAKYADGNEKVKATACFKSIPTQLAKDNKKFMYKTIEKNARSSKYLGSINWLVDAGIVNIAYNVTRLEKPLAGFKDEDYFKIYMGDTGLLVAMLDNDTNIQLLNGDIKIYKGAIFENVISQILKAIGFPLYFYNRSNSLELDFLISTKGQLLPLEVKADNKKAKSLSTILSENPNMKGIKLINGNIGVIGNTITLPWYMTAFFGVYLR